MTDGVRIKQANKVSLQRYGILNGAGSDVINWAAVIREVEGAIEDSFQDDPPYFSIGYVGSEIWLYLSLSAIGDPDVCGPQWRVSLDAILADAEAWGQYERGKLAGLLEKAAARLDGSSHPRRP